MAVLKLYLFSRVVIVICKLLQSFYNYSSNRLSNVYTKWFLKLPTDSGCVDLPKKLQNPFEIVLSMYNSEGLRDRNIFWNLSIVIFVPQWAALGVT